MGALVRCFGRNLFPGVMGDVYGPARFQNLQNSPFMYGLDATEGPTPMSALRHAATMAAAGIFLVVCTLGSVVFVSILLIRGVWTGISFLQENRYRRMDEVNDDQQAWTGTQLPVT